jgi:hypothetical protein
MRKLRGLLVELGLSIELIIPPFVDVAQIIAVGQGCYPYGIVGDMDVAEAIQWAFSDPTGVAALAAMGVTWIGMTVGNMKGPQSA